MDTSLPFHWYKEYTKKAQKKRITVNLRFVKMTVDNCSISCKNVQSCAISTQKTVRNKEVMHTDTYENLMLLIWPGFLSRLWITTSEICKKIRQFFMIFCLFCSRYWKLKYAENGWKHSVDCPVENGDISLYGAAIHRSKFAWMQI